MNCIRIENVNWTPIYWTLLVLVALLALLVIYIEYQSAALRTEVNSVPGALRFCAQVFTVEACRPGNTVRIRCRSGHCKTQALDGGEEVTRTGALTLALPAAGMRIRVGQIVLPSGSDAAPTPTGFSRILFTASDESTFKRLGKSGGQRSTIQLHPIPDTVAQSFQHFCDGLTPWFEKLERDLH
jgi:hypothetical protein